MGVSAVHTRALFRRATICALLSLVLVLAVPGITQAGATPVLTLGPVSVLDGVVTLTGTVGGSPDVTLDLSINGQPVGLGAAGQFTATVNLGGQSVIAVELLNPLTGEIATISIPISLAGPGGSIPATVLDALNGAGISLTIPPDGFQILDGSPLTIEGQVLNPSNLVSLTVNGVDILNSVGPGGNYSTTVPGTTTQVIIVATDNQGVSQTSVFQTTQISSVIQTSAGLSVSAQGAQGVRITKIRYLMRAVKQTRRLTMEVTVKDKRGYLIRSAIVRVSSIPGSKLQSGPLVTTTNKIGKARFVLRPKAQAFGQRLRMKAKATIPRASATRVTSVRLPRLARIG